MKILYVFLLTLFTLNAIGQEVTSIKGNLKMYPKKDTISFFNSFVPNVDYDIDTMIAPVSEGKFALQNKLTYPHLFYAMLQSDKGTILAQPKLFFIDPSTKDICINYKDWGKSFVSGSTSSEYEDKFKNFLFPRARISTEESLIELLYNKDPLLDSVLFEYTVQNPNSYVSLWLLAERFHYLGYSKLRNDAVDSFTDIIREKPFWKKLKKEINGAFIRDGNYFPRFRVKDTADSNIIIQLPKAKIILVDFWFSFCKPCLAAIPTLRSLKTKYSSRGFEILGISTDPASTKLKWLKTINKEKMDWPHYLDLAGAKTSKLKINSFPRYLLLDENGIIIKTQISITEIDSFLNNYFSK